MFHRPTGSTCRQRIEPAVVLALTLILTMVFPAAAAPVAARSVLTDFGDLPASYPTSLAADGPRHSLSSSGSLWLGGCVDGESDGQPTNDTATGDNIATGHPIYGTGSAGDEDGVKRVAGKGGASNGGGWTNGEVGTGSSGNGGAVEVTITASACLGAFFDFNRNPTVGNLQSVTLRDINGNIVVQPIAGRDVHILFQHPARNIQPQRADPTTALRQIPGHKPGEQFVRFIDSLLPDRPGAEWRSRGLPLELRPQRRDPVGHDGFVGGNAAGAAPGACDLPGCPGRRHRACATPRLAPSRLTGQPDYRLMPAPPSKSGTSRTDFAIKAKSVRLLFVISALLPRAAELLLVD